MQLSKDEFRAIVADMCLMDDIFMKVFFQDNIMATQLILQIILDKQLQVLKVDTEFTVANLVGRSVRLDILAVDADGVYYDIELQNDNDGAAEKRARLNSSLLDAYISKKGSDYRKLPKSVVIFITEEDYLGYDLPIYHIKRVIEENKERFEDEQEIIYVNGAFKANDALGLLVHDLFCRQSEEFYYKDLQLAMTSFKEAEAEVTKMTALYQKYAQKYAEKYAQKYAEAEYQKGQQQGELEGERKNAIQKAKQMIEDKLPLDFVAKYSAPLTFVEVQKLAQGLEV